MTTAARPTNAALLLDSILTRRLAELAPDLTAAEYFEIFVAEQLLKDFDLSYDDIHDGLVGGGADGGIDAIYVFVNGQLVHEDTDLSYLKKHVSIELFLVQAKTASGFSESAIDRFSATASDLFDLSRDLDSLASVYNSRLRDRFRLFRESYTTLAARFPSLSVSFHYATKGADPHPNVARKVDRLKSLVHTLLASAAVAFEFEGARELLELALRAQRTVYSLPLAETPMSASGAGSFICLVTLTDYFNFITDASRRLRRSLFESNVRDYEGATQVNQAISHTLHYPTNEDFWWLNNGITILVTKATLSSKMLTIEDPQIVNGLQTSTEVFNYFTSRNTTTDVRTILIRVIVPPANDSRDNIVKATNNQTDIPPASLRVTDTIHRDIELFLASNGFFYERRRNFYKNQSKPLRRIVTPVHLAQAVTSVALHRPHVARARPSSLLLADAEYQKIFSPKYPLSLYLACLTLLYDIDTFLRLSSSTDVKQRTNVRLHAALYAAALMANKPRPSSSAISDLQISTTPTPILEDAVRSVIAVYVTLGASDQVAKSPLMSEQLLSELDKRLLPAATRTRASGVAHDSPLFTDPTPSEGSK